MEKKPIIIFVGAYYYGNLGDDLYPEILEYFLADRYELHFFNSDIQDFTEKESYLLENRRRIHKLIYAGGGLIYDNDTAHREYMQHYSDFARRHAIPYGFTSIGIQREDQEERDPFSGELQHWHPILEHAEFIYCRHPWDHDYLRRNLDAGRIAQYPDLAYLLRFIHGIERNPEPGDQVVVIAQSPLLDADFMQSVLPSIDGHDVVFLLFGQDDQVHHELMEKWCECAGLDFPSCRVFSDKNRRTYLRQIADSRLVLTGRYHGLVLARSLGVPVVYNPRRSPDKFNKEATDGRPVDAFRNLVI